MRYEDKRTMAKHMKNHYQTNCKPFTNTNLAAKLIRINESTCILAFVVVWCPLLPLWLSQRHNMWMSCYSALTAALFSAWVHRTIWNCIHAVGRMPSRFGIGENYENSRLWLKPKRYNMTVSSLAKTNITFIFLSDVLVSTIRF